jgi:hypothetical protein
LIAETVEEVRAGRYGARNVVTCSVKSKNVCT